MVSLWLDVRLILNMNFQEVHMAMRKLLETSGKLIAIASLLVLSSCGFTPSDQRYQEVETVVASELPAYVPFPLIASASRSAEQSTNGIWKHYSLPGKQATAYRYAWIDGRHGMQATARQSASMLRQSIRVEPAQLGVIKFSWKVPQLIAGADLSQRETHDSPVRVVLAFEGDRSKFSMKNSMLSELASALTGEPMPYATLMYVWCNACPQGEMLSSPRTDRIREIPLESGPDRLGQWRHYERDIRADFEKAFGEPPGALLDVGLMSDTDNTRETAVAWYGAVSLAD